MAWAFSQALYGSVTTVTSRETKVAGNKAEEQMDTFFTPLRRVLSKTFTIRDRKSVV